MRIHSTLFLLPALLAALASGSAHADIAPNPGGAVVVTNSTTSSYVFQDTNVTQVVNEYATTLSAFLNGSQVFSASFSAPYSDASVQAAVSAADAVLSGDGASFGAPQLISDISLLQGSVTAPPVVTCNPCNQATGITTVTTINTFGPATILVGDNQSDIFTILAGQLDINVNTDIEYFITRDIVTADTYLDTQTYDIFGTTASASVPEPASPALLVLGLGVMWGLRRRRCGLALP